MSANVEINSKSICGQVFGILKVIKREGIDKSGKNSTWTCLCECGNLVTRTRPNLRRKGIHSCGCIFLKRMQETFCTHKMTDSNAYHSWTDMKTRCLNPRNLAYKNYGGRGIKICERWLNSFENFLIDMGNPEKGMTLERIDNELGYSAENCKWIPKSMQSKNRRKPIRHKK